ncbi:MAG: VCBS repeat-containing protein [Myxococcales bacterium]|nr:VCBS repeat-containing protein [Myxococcales bacterium]
MRTQFAFALAALALLPATAEASLWEDATSTTIGTTAGWSNKIELADIDGDGDVDILFANGGNYSSAGAPEQNYAFLNQGPGLAFADASDAVFGTTGDLARVVKARDIDGDGDLDVLVGATYQTQSRLFRNDGGGAFTEVTASNLPQVAASVGDLEAGDVDGDGDLDLLVADWGAGNPGTNGGGRTMLWLNDGAGGFTDVTAAQMPDVLVRWSWDLELVDVDDDYDLDALVSCKSCTGSVLFRNDGAGTFAHDSDALPQFANNYEFEAMDIDSDGDLDLITVNDGAGLREHVFVNADGSFTDGTGTLWPTSENLGSDDNVVAFLDVESDGDADFVIGSLNGSDRLLENDGSGRLTVVQDVMTGTATPGTLGLAFADLNGDGKLDAVQGQGEVASADKVFLGVDIPADTAPPSITRVKALAQAFAGDTPAIRARVHDTKSPLALHDFESVELRWSLDGGAEQTIDMSWYGEYLWRGDLPALATGELQYRVCAVDAATNQACSDAVDVTVTEALDPGPDAGPDFNPDADPGADSNDGGCGCRLAARTSPSPWAMLALVALLAIRRRNKRRKE